MNKTKYAKAGARVKSEQPVALTPEQIAYATLEAIGEKMVRQWLMHKELERLDRAQAITNVVSVQPIVNGDADGHSTD